MRGSNACEEHDAKKSMFFCKVRLSIDERGYQESPPQTLNLYCEKTTHVLIWKKGPPCFSRRMGHRVEKKQSQQLY